MKYTNYLISILISLISFFAYTVFTTSQANKIDSQVQKTLIKGIDKNINILRKEMNNNVYVYNKKIDRLSDSLRVFQSRNLQEHLI